VKVIFFGTPLFAAKVLSYLLENNIEIAAVVTKPDRPQGRSAAPVPTPVKCVAEAQNPPLPVYQPEIVSIPEFASTLEAYQADLFVVVAYGEIIKQHLLDMPKKGCINLHGSLLPKYRGAAPIQWSIINGEKETGVTIIHMVKKMDAGDMIASQSVVIGPDTTYGELEQELCRVGSELLLQTIHAIEKGTDQKIAQDPSLVTFASKIELEDCKIDWNEPADKIHNLVRGVNPHPGAWCLIEIKGQPKRLKIIKTCLMEGAVNSPGEIIDSYKNAIVIGCGKNALSLLQIQLEGKKAMTAEEFLRGFPAGTFKFLID
jgi:methionyl-tRNA formyltransferase